MVTQQAIVVRNARKSYGKGVQILDGLDLTVSSGSIYGLLGASGCGKTTLLSCVVGVRKFDSGEIWVLGGRPGTRGSGIPGPRVGYMPQEISLVQEFNVIGALYYFGRINGLPDHEIEERYEHLSSLLQLPPRNRLLKDMSGGQQRRVSFGAALLHKPELLILDEPTVGLDPVLRDNIWNYLVKITHEEGTTVVITTHYIEEAKQADRIGLMRCGKLLAESSPGQLLDRFQCDSLEEAFLELSRQQKENQEHGVQDIFHPEYQSASATSAIASNEERNRIKKDFARSTPLRSSFSRRFKALMIKNIVQFLRHIGGILFALVLPLIQVMIFFNAIGRDPTGIEIAVVNDEAGNCNFGKNIGQVIYDAKEFECDYVDLSCRFIREFNDSIAKKAFYEDLPRAAEAVRTGKAVGTMYFSGNFSKALLNRQEDVKAAPIEDVIASSIQIQLDMGNRQIGLHVQKRLFERFFEIYEEIVEECHIPKKFADVPLHFEDPIYGTKDQKYSTFVAPGFILTLIFFLSTSVTSSIIISDRDEGVWNRSVVQGVATAEILMSHLLTQLSTIVLQVTVALCVTFIQFGLECKGSLFTVIWMVFLTGVCGMSYGFFISVICTSHTMANYMSLGSFYPVILLCGCIWPIEAMPKFLKWISFTLPTTVPSMSLRGILDKGYPFADHRVYSGFIVVTGWIAGLLGLCLIRLRSKSA